MMSLIYRIYKTNENETNEQTQQNRKGFIDPKNMLVVGKWEGGWRDECNR